MATQYPHPGSSDSHKSGESSDQTETQPRRTGSGMSKSMHDGVEVWCDCCSCEAEPYWIEAMQHTDKNSKEN
jgi:hypothetical protein